MARGIYVNLPVADLARSTALYRAMGFERNPAMSNESGAALVWSDTITVMLLDHALYARFTAKPIADTRRESAVLLCLSVADRDEVDRIARDALAAGASELHGAEDEGFMYSRAFEDLDGHGWQVMWLEAATGDG